MLILVFFRVHWVFVFLQIFCKQDLKFSLLSITILRIFSSVTFSIVLLLKENGLLKPTVRKWHLCVKIFHKIILILLERHVWVFCPACNYMLKVNNRNTRTRCGICSRLTIKTPKQHPWRRSGLFIVNFKHISHLVLVFLLLTLSR